MGLYSGGLIFGMLLACIRMHILAYFNAFMLLGGGGVALTH